MANRAEGRQLTLTQRNEIIYLKKRITTHFGGKVTISNLTEEIDKLDLSITESKKLNLVDLRLQKQSLEGLQLLYKKFKIPTDKTLKDKMILLQYQIANKLKKVLTSLTFDNLITYAHKIDDYSILKGWDFGATGKNQLNNQSFLFVDNICSKMQPYKAGSK